MIDANSQFFAILTNVGMAKQANADALGIPWLITQMGVGDANPNGLADPPNPVPSASQTKLLNEWRRKPLNQLKIDPVNPAVIIAEQIIPADEGGKWIREIGLYDADGDLVAVANCAPSFKPMLSQGSGRTQIVRMNFIVTSTGNIQLKIDPAIVLASRAYVDAAILEVLPKNKTPGEFTRVKVNDRGVVVSGDNPETLAGMGIKDSYTKAEIEAMIAQASALPVGATVAFPLDKVAPGFLELDGSVKSIAVYPDLAAFLGTAFNKGDEGAGNFRLPESRGEFLRGWDHGRGIDAGRAVGSLQAHQTENHLHVTPVNDTASQLCLQEARGSNWPYGATTGVIAGTNTAATGVSYTAVGEDQWLNTGPNIAQGTGETRPRNLAVVWCIKAWNAPINQGNIDIAALAALATQATEVKLGTAKIATQAQTDAGTDDATIVTPKKMRWGFQIQKAANGYIVFPSWLGGLVLQWGTLTTTTSADSVVGFPIQFPTALLSLQATAYIGGASSRDTNVMVRNDGGSRTTFSVGAFLTGTRMNEAIYWWAVGH
ncbi:phage tail protein [Pseudomonas atacamensis]|uniref:phage tail protein n=1 Tax=Pseudomonas atacamensis TaxID=2565368 RepID=UPI0028BCA18B|nr:phage tail protein [Pseudomonas atacamensis]MDT6918355.1 phage tail protein [Pseudomonas atacamensis]